MPRAPQPLKYVAYSYLLIGFFSMAVMVAGVTRGSLVPDEKMAAINLGIGALPIGWGLLRLRRDAYAWAIIACTVYLFLSPMTLFLFVLSPVRFAPRLPLSPLLLQIGMALGGLIWALSMGLAAWQFQVLHSKPVQRAFAGDAREREAP